MKIVIAIVALSATTLLAAACTGPLCLGAESEGGGEGGGCSSGNFGTAPPQGVPADAACSTGAWWVGGNHESEQMRPGTDCISCHAREGEGPQYTVAGTVMGGLGDTDDCQGVSDVTVRITDADGQVSDLVTNAAGNFYLRGTVAFPYTATLVRGGTEVSMVTAQSNGNCMACHTAEGAAGAPGRIVAP